ncbi:ESX-1 secretion-associated protein [Actinosynnema pretiosum subsp. pretiosum]|uniref:ESX-1 secretion-associated protein n=2 Tax=Actinosynnema TaxID=40566 RepID=C6W8D9_ACTMD|nr:hypothetical protein [Actinosynnema mirum]ACU38986.1 hypothetical protein Amir_5165 [Actinosynnema mirum DSM 43827]AXX32579.1 hypothetical protein APASM_5214 [Actinosynnema pretiosum subsp. pretiosum]QUF03522.1 ESX-1 secretion-associated protein [Actinosynnema pretiosum subsp. pretiosum]
MSDGFSVDPAELEGFAGVAEGHAGTAGQIKGLVDRADVGDKSWGVVGLFVKSTYTGMLGDLKELFGDLEEGLRGVGERFRATAEDYRGPEEAIQRAFDGIDTGSGGR